MRVMVILLALLGMILASGWSAHPAAHAMPGGSTIHCVDVPGDRTDGATQPDDHGGCQGDHDRCADLAGCCYAGCVVGGLLPEGPSLAAAAPTAGRRVAADAAADGRVVPPRFVPPRLPA